MLTLKLAGSQYSLQASLIGTCLIKAFIGIKSIIKLSSWFRVSAILELICSNISMGFEIEFNSILFVSKNSLNSSFLKQASNISSVVHFSRMTQKMT